MQTDSAVHTYISLQYIMNQVKKSTWQFQLE